jgi:uncharacterized membrane protein YfcA
MGLLKKLLSQAANSGIKFPHAFDPATKTPSFRLMCAYVSFLLCAASVGSLHIHEHLVASWTSIGLFCICMVFYVLKSLTKAKIDLKDAEIELEDTSNKS